MVDADCLAPDLIPVKEEPQAAFPRLKRKFTDVIDLDTPPHRVLPVGMDFDEDADAFPSVGDTED